jgi:hypothetical protein
MLSGDGRTEAFIVLTELHRVLRTEVLGLEDLSDLDLAFAVHRVGAALYPFDCLLERLGLDEPEASDELFRFGERAVDDTALAAIEVNACPS